MSKTTDKLRQRVTEYNGTANGFALHLQLTLAELVVRGMKQKNLTLDELSARTGVSALAIECIVCSELSNCTLDTAGRLLHALGIRGCIAEVSE